MRPRLNAADSPANVAADTAQAAIASMRPRLNAADSIKSYSEQHNPKYASMRPRLNAADSADTLIRVAAAYALQ